MKKRLCAELWLPLVAGLTVLLSGCGKPVAVSDAEVSEVSEVAVAPPAPVAPPAVELPKATPALAVAEAPPAPEPELAPEGVFYLIAAARVETDSGIIGLKPGTGLRLVRPGIYLSAHGEVPLQPGQVTNDLALARQAASQDASQQAALRATLEARARAVAEAQAERDAQTPENRLETVPVPSRPPASSLGGGGLQSAGGTLGKTHSNTKDKVYTDSQGRRYWRDVQGRSRYDF